MRVSTFAMPLTETHPGSVRDACAQRHAQPKLKP
jgi:hypothetical protein